MSRKDNIAVAEALIAITMWALSFILIKIALRELSTTTLITLRFAVATIVMLPVIWRSGFLASITLADLPRFAILGVIGVTAHQFLQVAGQESASAGMAALCAATAPAFTIILAAIFLHERMSRWQTLGVCIALAGASIVSLAGSDWAISSAGRSAAFGNLLVVLSSTVWAAAAVMGKKMMIKRPSIVVTAGMLVFGLIFCIPFFVAIKGWREIPGLSAQGWVSIVALGVLCTTVAHLANNQALKTISAQRVAIIQNLEPFLAIIGAWIILGERIGIVAALGGIAIIAGVWIAEKFDEQTKKEM
ncbi:MAG: DMT family transporter [Armatimonadetes bacterium]|nr:DMT family transporter [Armatimonadota bacterium]